MSLESASARKKKRIVQQEIGGFRTAKEAIVFGNTVNSVMQDKVKSGFKYKQYIAAPKSKIAITEDYDGETILRMSVLEIADQNTAMFVVETIKAAISMHTEVHKCVLNIINEVIREKPQPQRIG